MGLKSRFAFCVLRFALGTSAQILSNSSVFPLQLRHLLRDLRTKFSKFASWKYRAASVSSSTAKIESCVRICEAYDLLCGFHWPNRDADDDISVMISAVERGPDLFPVRVEESALMPSLLLTRVGRSRLVFVSDSLMSSDIQEACDLLWSLNNALQMDGELVCSSPPLRMRTREADVLAPEALPSCVLRITPYLRSSQADFERGFLRDCTYGGGAFMDLS